MIAWWWLLIVAPLAGVAGLLVGWNLHVQRQVDEVLARELRPALLLDRLRRRR